VGWEETNKPAAWNTDFYEKGEEEAIFMCELNIQAMTKIVTPQRRTLMIILSEAGGLYTAVVGLITVVAYINTTKKFENSVNKDLGGQEQTATMMEKVN